MKTPIWGPDLTRYLTGHQHGELKPWLQRVFRSDPTLAFDMLSFASTCKASGALDYMIDLLSESPDLIRTLLHRAGSDWSESLWHILIGGLVRADPPDLVELCRTAISRGCLASWITEQISEREDYLLGMALGAFSNHPRGLHVWIRPTSDLPGQWVGEVVETGLVSQGAGPVRALQMITEATSLVTDLHTRRGQDPFPTGPIRVGFVATCRTCGASWREGPGLPDPVESARNCPHRGPDRTTYQVKWSEEDGEYVATCSDFPSLSWLAPDPQGALAGILQVVADVKNNP